MRKTNHTRVLTPGITPGALTVPDGARYIGISEPTLWRMLRANTVPPVRLGGRTVVRKVDLDALLARAAGVSA